MPNIPSVPSSSLSLEQHLREALKSLIYAYKGLEGEEKEEQVGQLVNYIRDIIMGGNPFIREEEEEEEEKKEEVRGILRGLVEEVRALHKEVAPIKETYTERLRKGLPSSSSLPSLPLLPSAPFPSSRSSTSTRSKKKQLQERKLVLITDEKDQPLNIFSIRNKVN